MQMNDKQHSIVGTVINIMVSHYSGTPDWRLSRYFWGARRKSIIIIVVTACGGGYCHHARAAAELHGPFYTGVQVRKSEGATIATTSVE